MQADSYIFLIHVYASLFMLGLIWFIQLVHYPSFFYVDKNNFSEFEKFHASNISIIVMPVMILELLTGLYIGGRAYFELPYLINIILIACIWASTFFLSVPAHNILSKQWSEAAAKKLVSTNWIRTVLWTLKALLVASIWYQRGLF